MTSRPGSRRPEFGLAMRLARVMLEHSIPSAGGSGWAICAICLDCKVSVVESRHLRPAR